MQVKIKEWIINLRINHIKIKNSSKYTHNHKLHLKHNAIKL